MHIFAREKKINFEMQIYVCLYYTFLFTCAIRFLESQKSDVSKYEITFIFVFLYILMHIFAREKKLSFEMQIYFCFYLNI